MNLRLALLPLALAFALPALADAPSAARGFTVDDMVRLDRYSSPVLSPDGGQVLYLKRVVDEKLKASTQLWVVDTRAGAVPRLLSPAGWSVANPSFSADGREVYFLSSQQGSNQLYRLPLAGGTPVAVTALPLDVADYKLSPSGDQVALALAVFADCGADLACSKARFEARGKRPESGVLYEGLFVRHWDTWNDGSLNRVFVADMQNGVAATPQLMAPNLQGDMPSKPFGDFSDLAFSPDGKQLVMSVRPAGRSEPWSTNFDLYRVNVDGSGTLENLTQGNPAWDAGPVFNADGSKLYYRAMKRAGFEADRFALMEMNLADGAVREIAPRWDRSAGSITLSADGKTLYTVADDMGEHPLFAVDIASGAVRRVAGEGSIGSVSLAGGQLVYTRNSLKSGNQIVVQPLRGGEPRALTASAQAQLPNVRFGDFEQFSFKGWNNETVHGYVVKPWNYEEGKQYPVAFIIHGGPQGSFGNGWSYRWNPQTYAGQGYAVVMIDFHGSTGYGQAFTDAISGHWGDRPLEDLQKGWAAAQAQYPWLDGKRACALGASYGGFMTNWIAGNWFNADGSAPFKCLVTHNGVFDTRSMGLVTEELWFTEWEFGGTVWDKPAAYERFNPARHLDKWQTPMLVVGGQNDFRVPIDQSLSAFTALQRRGIDSQFLYFPDENHWVLKSHNSVQWHNTVNAWLKKHIGQ